MSFRSILELILTSIFTGFGVALGSYFANKHVIEKFEKVIKRVWKFIFGSGGDKSG